MPSVFTHDISMLYETFVTYMQRSPSHEFPFSVGRADLSTKRWANDSNTYNRSVINNQVNSSRGHRNSIDFIVCCAVQPFRSFSRKNDDRMRDHIMENFKLTLSSIKGPNERSPAVLCWKISLSNPRFKSVCLCPVLLPYPKLCRFRRVYNVVDKIANVLDDRHRYSLKSIEYLKTLNMTHPYTRKELFNIDILFGTDFNW